MDRLSIHARALIGRKVWAIWFVRRFALPVFVLLLALLESVIVLVGPIINVIINASESLGGLWSFGVAEVANTNFVVLLVTALFMVGVSAFSWSVLARVANGAGIVLATLRKGILKKGF
jgi:hypothetical protein